VTLNYLKDYFPATELQPQDSLGYLIAYKDAKEDGLKPVMMGGPLQKRMIKETETLDLSTVNEEMSLYKIENHLGVENLYAAVEKIGLYQFNTPFENEEWYIVGIMREDYLLSYANRIKQTLWMSLIMALVLGALGGVFTSYHMTRPIVALVNQLKIKTPEQALKLKRTGYLELDELAHAVEVANELMLESASRLSKVVSMFEWPIGAYEVKPMDSRYFVTDNFFKILGQNQFTDTSEMGYEAFIQTLKSVFNELEPGEEDVYKINTNPVRWIRINRLRTETSEIGAIVDVTDEMLEKKQMRHERDHDPLTQLLNRKGFQWAFEKWYDQPIAGASALVMFDLDNLKKVNDTYGHKWGDRYIVSAVKCLSEMTADGLGIVGRRSGDEFVLLLYGAESKDAIRSRLNAFYDRLKANPIEFPDQTHNEIMISGGLMWIESKSFSYDEILHFADEALYVAKREGKGKYVESTWV
jgi:diguanylate cyclase (GGDEF)-like protein